MAKRKNSSQMKTCLRRTRNQPCKCTCMTTVSDLMVLDFLSYGFMQRALITGAAVAICCSMIGLYLVLKRYSLFGDALSHMAFGGIALGYFIDRKSVV